MKSLSNVAFYFNVNDPVLDPSFNCNFKFKTSTDLVVEANKELQHNDYLIRWQPDLLEKNELLDQATCEISKLKLKNEYCSFNFKIIIPAELNTTENELTIDGELKVKYTYQPH